MEVVLTRGEMQAFIKLAPEDLEVEEQPTLAKLRILLKQNGVVHGAIEDNLKRVVRILSGREEYDGRDILAAEGTSPVQGENARIKHKVDLGQAIGKLLPGGSIDYRERDLVKNVREGEILAEKIPPGKGTPGKKVTGEEVPAPDGNDVKLVAGESTRVSPDGMKLLASIAGMVLSNTEGTMYVSDEFVIRGDVDYSTGNVDTVGRVTIEGDVLSGFRVEADKDITVNGSVEDATVKAGGNVKVRYGMKGRDIGIIEAGGNIEALFVEHANLRAEGDIKVARQILHSTIITKGQVIVDRDRGLIAGGNILARHGVTAKEIGSKLGTKTLISVGVDPDVLGDITTVEEELGMLNKQIRKMDAVLRAARTKGRQGQLTDAEKKSMKRISAERKRAVPSRDNLNKRKEALDKRIMSDLSASVRVQGDVHSGVIIRYHDIELKLTEPLSNVTFSFDRGTGKVKVTDGALGD